MANELLAQAITLTHKLSSGRFGVLSSTTISPNIMLSEGFESGQLLTNADAGTVNTVGFRWLGTNRTSIVTPTHVVWNGSAVSEAKPAGKDWTPLTGNHSLRFRYPRMLQCQNSAL